MAKGSVYEIERTFLRDPRSGLTILRLTHSSCIAQNLYFEMCSFTDDDRYVMVVSQRVAGRDAPWDIYRVRTDGMELVQVTECDDLSGIVFSPALNALLFQTGGEVRKMDILSLKEEVIAKAPGKNAVYARSHATIGAKGKTYFGSCIQDNGKACVFKVDVASGGLDILDVCESPVHLHVDPSEKWFYLASRKGGEGTCCVMDTDGRNIRPYSFTRFAHHTWFGETGLMQGTLVPPGHALATYREGDAEPVILTEGRYYWHSSASRDAQWIISDTNWPQEGLYLLHVPTRTVSYVCDTQSSCSHPQWTHPHPSLSPGMKYVLYNSDMTGIGQVYLCLLTEEFLEQAKKGYLCRPNLLA